MKLSIIIPVFNEEENLQKLYQELSETLITLNYDYEVIMVDDGSTDKSLQAMVCIAEKEPGVKVIIFSRNFGQTTAIAAGIEFATGEVIILMDSDLENEPQDIPRLLKKLDQGYDVVSGWRQKRWVNSYFTRRLPSLVANWLISKISGLKLHDYGCTLKAYHRKVLQDMSLYGEMHRFIPAYAYWQGAKVGELTVNFRPRVHGKSKYGVVRTFRVVLDLIMMKFLDKYMVRPIHFFGGLGFISLFLGILSGTLAVILKITGLRSFVATPLPVLATFLVIVGVLLVAMGILAEMMMRTYYESQNKRTYTIKDTINIVKE